MIKSGNNDDKTASVTYFIYKNNNYYGVYDGYDGYISAYSGNIVIPKTITFSGTTYSVTSIGEHAFSRCYDRVTSVTIPNSITSIGKYAFSRCYGLTSLVVDKNNGTYDSRNNCNAIIETSTNNLIVGCKNTTIPNSVTSIGEHAFEDCSRLTSVTIPNSVTSIGYGAFYNCSGLTSVTIGNSVTSIGYGAFSGCSGLTSVTVDKNNGTYDSRNNCNAIIETSTNKLIVGCKNTTIGNSVSSIGEYAFEGCSGLTSVTFNAEKCTEMGSYNYPVFRDCTNLKSLTIGNKVTTIPDYAFKDCSGLTSVTIPNSVTSTGDCVFSGCTGLTTMTIPNSVTTIGYSAFSVCSGLTSVTIPNSVTSIDNYAFYGCSGLTSVTIPNSVTSIGYDAFYGCSGLTKLVSLAVEPPTCGIGAFEYVDKTTCQLLVPEESINKYKTADQWKEFLNILGYNGVDDVSVDTPDALYEVYNLQGVRVGGGMREAEVTADVLPHGVYILVSPQNRKKLKI